MDLADPQRVAILGLSGGSWQTITISALDPRVTVANPVAGFFSFRARVRYLKDLSDSEQTPCDFATVADYAHFAALMAPRPTLLTYNAKDNCCFESNYALATLLEAAQPVFELIGAETKLCAHVNHDPGTHNFGLDNRQAFCRMVVDWFFPGDASFDTRETGCEAGIKPPRDLVVELSPNNAMFLSLARDLAARLPQDGTLPRLREILRPIPFRVTAGTPFREGSVTGWKLMMGKDFTVSAVKIAPAHPQGTALLLSEQCRTALGAQVEAILATHRRVVALDPFYYRESKIASYDWLLAILAAAVGERPLGIQASQLAAASWWAAAQIDQGPGTVAVVGPRSGVVALAAAALEPKAFADLRLFHPMEKELMDQGVGVDKMSELFCFGLLRDFDMKRLVSLATPRPVEFVK